MATRAAYARAAREGMAIGGPLPPISSSMVVAAPSAAAATLSTPAGSPHTTSLPYNPGRLRAKRDLFSALGTQDGPVQLRRLEYTIRAVRGDPTCGELIQQGQTKVAELRSFLRPGAGLTSEADGRPQDCEVDSATKGRAQEDPEDKGYAWIRTKNDPPERQARKEIAAKTQQAVECRGYSIAGKVRRLHHVQDMLAGTRVVSPTAGDWPSSGTGAHASGWTKETVISVEKGVVLEVATKKKLENEARRVAAVNAAAAYHCGGGFLTGGRHALEEAMCVQSSLFASLELAEKKAEALNVKAPAWANPPKSKKDGSDWHMHIPEDGAILSPLVEVFRGGTNDGYPFEDQPVALEAVVSVAMPNCNDRMSDSPVDKHTEAYRDQLLRKWRAALMAAARYTRADCIVIPDAGCGVFRNDANQVGEALGSLLGTEFKGRFDEVVIAYPGGKGGDLFAAALQKAVESAMTTTTQ